MLLQLLLNMLIDVILDAFTMNVCVQNTAVFFWSKQCIFHRQHTLTRHGCVRLFVEVDLHVFRAAPLAATHPSLRLYSFPPWRENPLHLMPEHGRRETGGRRQAAPHRVETRRAARRRSGSHTTQEMLPTLLKYNCVDKVRR